MAGLCDFADLPVTHGAVAAGAARQGTRFHKSLSYSAGGSPLSLVEFGIGMQVRQNPESAQIILDLGPYVVVTNAAGGLFDLDVPATVMAVMPFSTPLGFFYDLILTPGMVASEAFALLAGRFVILPEVTR